MKNPWREQLERVLPGVIICEEKSRIARAGRSRERSGMAPRLRLRDGAAWRKKEMAVKLFRGICRRDLLSRESAKACYRDALKGISITANSASRFPRVRFFQAHGDLLAFAPQSFADSNLAKNIARSTRHVTSLGYKSILIILRNANFDVLYKFSIIPSQQNSI